MKEKITANYQARLGEFKKKFTEICKKNQKKVLTLFFKK